MADISEILSNNGIEIPEEKKESFLKDFRASYKSAAELDKIREKKESLESRITELDEVISGYKKLDIDGLKSEIDSWKNKYEEADKEYTSKINKQILNNAFSKFNFSSKTARDGIFKEAFSSDKIKFDNDNVIGLDEFIEIIKQNDPKAFAEEIKEEEAPKFTRGIQNKSSKINGDPSKMDFKTYKKWRKENY